MMRGAGHPHVSFALSRRRRRRRLNPTRLASHDPMGLKRIRLLSGLLFQGVDTLPDVYG